MRSIQRLGFLAICLLLVGTLVLPAMHSAEAGGAGGIDVRPGRVCLNGVRFSGQAAIPEVLNNHKFVSKIFSGYVGVPYPLVAVGTNHVYTAVGESNTFTITYPIGTFAVGDPVTYSALADDSSGYGGGQFGNVSRCLLPTLLPTPIFGLPG